MKENPMNNYAVKMAEYNLQRNPTAQEVILVLNNQKRDHYQDAVSEENYRVKKWATVKKDPTLHYVQFDNQTELMEDVANCPWTVSMTILGIQKWNWDKSELVTCIPQTDDQILMNGKLYTISLVEPVNRQMDGIVNCMVYPEHASPNDPLALYRVERVVYSDYTVYSPIWGGVPTHYSWDGTDWKPFASYARVDGMIQPSEMYIKDADGIVVSCVI